MKEEKEQEQIRILQTKAEYFKNNREPVHIKYKNGEWTNGQIINTSFDFFTFFDSYYKRKDIVFFIELQEISKFREKEVKNAKTS